MKDATQRRLERRGTWSARTDDSDDVLFLEINQNVLISRGLLINVRRSQRLVKTYTLTTIEQAVQVAKTLQKSWFRGHSTICNELTPAIFREDYKTISCCRPDIETFFIDTFRRGAPVLEKNLPEWGDYIEWLFLMQHHGAPTRLLDWTENALIALYFAVGDGNSEDGELWAMYPDEL